MLKNLETASMKQSRVPVKPESCEISSCAHEIREEGCPLFLSQYVPVGCTSKEGTVVLRGPVLVPTILFNPSLYTSLGMEVTYILTESNTQQ